MIQNLVLSNINKFNLKNGENIVQLFTLQIRIIWNPVTVYKSRAWHSRLNLIMRQYDHCCVRSRILIATIVQSKLSLKCLTCKQLFSSLYMHSSPTISDCSYCWQSSPGSFRLCIFLLKVEYVLRANVIVLSILNEEQ